MEQGRARTAGFGWRGGTITAPLALLLPQGLKIQAWRFQCSNTEP